MVLYVFQLAAVFVIRGKPYSGENVASVLIRSSSMYWIIPLLAFTWHVVSETGSALDTRLFKNVSFWFRFLLWP